MMTLEAKQKLAQAKIASMIRPVPASSKSTCTEKASASRDEMKDDPVDPLPEERAEIRPSTYGMRPLYSAVNINCDKWLLTMDESSVAKLENPPSFRDGIDRKTEQAKGEEKNRCAIEELRFLGCELIQAGAILLRLPQPAAATGQILFHRFYYQKSFATYHFEHAVMACLLLASKIEEAPRRARDVINVFHRLEQLHRLQRAGRRITKELTSKLQPRPLDARYVNTKNMVIKTERRILCALGFVVHVKHPHKLLVSYLHALKLAQNTQLMQKAWNYMNDGLRTDMFVRYRPETIACSCIFLAARTVSQPVALPSYRWQWFELFDASDRDVNAISLSLMQLYRSTRPNWTALNAHLEEVHSAKLPAAAEKTKTETIVQKILQETEKYRKNDENGRESRGGRNRRKGSSSKSVSPDRRRRGSPEGKRRGGRDKKRDEDRRRGKREREEKREKGRDRKERDREERRRSRERHERARERMKEREREVYQALGKRNRPLSPEPLMKVRR